MGWRSWTRGRVILGAAFLLTAFLAVFGPSLGYEFVYDDHWTIVENDWLDRPLAVILAPVLRCRAQALGIPDATRPSMIVSLWLDRRGCGLSPMGYHAHSLLLYAVDIVLAGVAAFRITGRRLAALGAAAFFMLSPLHAEPVASVNYREDLLSALAVLVPLLVLLRRPTRPDGWGAALASAAAAMVGLCAKENAVVLLAVVAILPLFLPTGRVWLRAHEKTFFALAGAFLLWGSWRAAALVAGDDIPRAPAAPFAEVLLATVRFEVLAVRDVFWPFLWSPEHSRMAPASSVWLVLLVGILVAIVVMHRRRWSRPMAFGLSLVLLAAVPSSPVARPVNEFADRYLFLSVLGGGLVWGAGFDRVLRLAERRVRSWGCAVGLGMMLAMSLSCFSATSVWASDWTLWQSAVVKAPHSPRAWTGLARARRLAGQLTAADDAIEHAIAIDPAYSPARVTKAFNRLVRGDVYAARAELDRIDPRETSSLSGFEHAKACAMLSPQDARVCAASRPK